MIGSSGCPPLLGVFEGWVRQGSPLLAGILWALRVQPRVARSAHGLRAAFVVSRFVRVRRSIKKTSGAQEGCKHPKRDSIAVLIGTKCQRSVQRTRGFRNILDKSYKSETPNVTKAAFRASGTKVFTDGSMTLTCCRAGRGPRANPHAGASEPCLKDRSLGRSDALGSLS